jgi:hypothetical protein
VQLLDAHAHPEVSLHSHSLADYMQRIYGADWPGVAELMLASADKLAKAGAYGSQALPELRLRRTAPAAGAVIGGRRSASGQSAAVRAALVKNASRPPAVSRHAAVSSLEACSTPALQPEPPTPLASQPGRYRTTLNGEQPLTVAVFPVRQLNSPSQQHSGRSGAKEICAPTTGLKALQTLPVAGARRRNLQSSSSIAVDAIRR